MASYKNIAPEQLDNEQLAKASRTAWRVLKSQIQDPMAQQTLEQFINELSFRCEATDPQTRQVVEQVHRTIEDNVLSGGQKRSEGTGTGGSGSGSAVSPSQFSN